MADKRLNVHVSQTGAEAAASGLGKIDKQITSLIGRYTTIAGVAYTAKKALDFTLESAKLQGRVDDLTLAFNSLAKAQDINASIMLNKMRSATHGTVSDLDLLQQANTALLLGLPVTEEEMGLLAEAGYRLGKAMGLDATRGLESLTVGIARQSRLWLDNIGLIIDVESANAKMAQSLKKSSGELTESERKIAFYNAAVEQTREKMGRLGTSIETNTDLFGRLTVRVQDLKIAFGSLFSSVDEKVFNDWARGIQLVVGNLETTAGIENLIKKIGELQDNLYTPKGQVNNIETIAKILKEITPLINQALPGNSIVNELNKFLNLKSGVQQKELFNLFQSLDGIVKQLKWRIEDLNKTPITLGNNIPQTIKYVDLLAEESRTIRNLIVDYNDLLNFKKQIKELDELPDWKVPDFAFAPDMREVEQWKTAVGLARQFTDNIGQAVIYGQNLGDAVVSSLKAIAAQLIADAALWAILSIITGNPAAATAIMSTGKATSPLGAIFGGSFANGGDFIATKPQIIMVGEGSRPERVNITPVGQKSQSSYVINIYGDGWSEETIAEKLIPKLNRIVGHA